MSKNLIFLAGKQAYKTIRNSGLHPEKVKAVYGAAGGPKWLLLNRLDRALFLDWFKERKSPLFLLGSSIGAWRFSAMSCKGPLTAQKVFEENYLNQRFSNFPSPKEITDESRRIINTFLEEPQLQEILEHPYLRPSFISVRCKGLTALEGKLSLGLGLFYAYLGNLINRRYLNQQFERTLFFHPKSNPQIPFNEDFKVNKVELTTQNYRQALLATGSIPLVMEGVKEIPGAPAGTYRDGGIIDYHLDLPFKTKEDEIVLFPHFSNRVIPGWLDKKLEHRKPSAENMQNVLLVAPSNSYLATLPNGKIPDRNDFKSYKGRDQERIRDWKTAVERGEILAEEFMEVVTTGRIKDLVLPMG